jgi:hypothetical protein
MLFVYFLYIFLGAGIWAIATQPVHMKKIQEEEARKQEQQAIMIEIAELKKEIEILRKELDEVADAQRNGSS